MTATIHTCIIGWVTLFTLPVAQDEFASVPTTRPLLKQRSVWMCHWVRHPPGCGAVVPCGFKYMAAARTAPCAVLTYTRDGIARGSSAEFSLRYIAGLM